MPHDPELADTVIDMDHRVPQGIGGKIPLIMVPAVALVDDSHGVGLDHTEIFEGGTPGHHVSLISGGKLHGHTQGDGAVLSCLQLHILCRAQIDPVRLSPHITQPVNLVRKVSDFYSLHILVPLLSPPPYFCTAAGTV